MLAITPHRVVEALSSSLQTQGLVRVIVVRMRTLGFNFLVLLRIPKLHIDVLMLRVILELTCCVRHWLTIKVWTHRQAEHLQNSRGHIGVAVGDVGSDILRNIRTSDQERNVDIRLVATAFSRG